MRRRASKGVLIKLYSGGVAQVAAPGVLWRSRLGKGEVGVRFGIAEITTSAILSL